MSWKILGWEEHPGLRREGVQPEGDMFEMRFFYSKKESLGTIYDVEV